MQESQRPDGGGRRTDLKIGRGAERNQRVQKEREQKKFGELKAANEREEREGCDEGRKKKTWRQSQKGRSLPDPSKFSHSTTHPEQLVRRGWRRQAGVRSTWPPLLTACCRRSQMKSDFLLADAPVGCLFYGAAPSTVTLHTGSRVAPSCAKCRLSEKINTNPHVSRDAGSFVHLQGRETADGCTMALSCLRAVLMASWASRCYQVTGC